MGELIEFKTALDDFGVEFEVEPAFGNNEITDERVKRIIEEEADVDEQIAIVNEKIEKLNEESESVWKHIFVGRYEYGGVLWLRDI